MAFLLEHIKLRFSYTILNPLRLPAYKGSVIRGVMGRAFRECSCATGNNDCRMCILASQCAYGYVFETLRASVGGGNDYSYIPHPFILEPPLDEKTYYRPGETFEVGLVLVGRAIEYLSYFIFALDRLGQYGLGPDRAKLHLEEVLVKEEETFRVIFRPGASNRIGSFNVSAIRIECLEEPEGRLLSDSEENHDLLVLDLITPFRYKDNGRIASSLTFPVLMRNIFRRLDTLGKAHGSGGLEIPFRSWLAAAEAVDLLAGKASWREWDRYSARQKTRMSLGGLVGKVDINGPWRPFLPFLEAARVVHIGKGTSFGLGRIELGRL